MRKGIAAVTVDFPMYIDRKAGRGRRNGFWCAKPVAADDDHADFVALGRRGVLDAVVQHDIHELQAR